MDFDWLNYLTLAQELIQPRPQQFSATNSEARYRAAISRAYYAIHHLAANYLEIHGPYTNVLGIRSHGDVYNQFMAGPTEEHMDFGSALLDLYDNRKISDYNPNGSGLDANNVTLIISSATQLVDALNTIKKIDASSKKS